MSQIKLLPQELINLIAAGEVVERPSSVLKELLENSIDAGSSEIIVNIEEAGNKLIEVKDNGHGINIVDAPLVLEQHATSKIKEFKDLENIYTLGFRGEALASISSVSEFTIIKSKSKSEEGLEIIKSNKGVEIIEKTNSRVGTTISIHNLFANIPARKKFLKKDSTEESHLMDTFIQTVLPYIDIHFELYIDKKLVYKLTRTNSLNNRVFEVFGKTTAKNLFENSTNINNIEITGLIGNSFIAKKTNKQQYLYINNRFVKSNLIAAAINQAYIGHIHRDLKPSYFLFLHLDPKVFDINVHPRKLDIKFSDDKIIFNNVYNFVKKTLEQYSKNLLNQVSNPDNSPKFNNIIRSSDAIYKETTKTQPSRGKNENYLSNKTSIPRQNRIKDSISFTKELFSFSNDTKIDQNNHNKFVDESIVNDLVMANSYRSSNENITPFQIFNTYICYERQDSLIIIDQHAAAEKVLFEKLIDQLGKVLTKPLLIPEIINLSNSLEKRRILEIKKELEEIGFLIEDFGGESISVNEIPEFSEINEFNLIINDFLKDENDLGVMINNEVINEYQISKSSYLKIATLACHGAIRAGQSLSKEEMLNLIKDIQKIKTNLNCPHGRPILWELPKSLIEKNFNRDI
jgi:DNA mismatch repair protein MutL